MRIEKEDDLLDVKIRKRVIDDINSPENQARKDESYKRYECYKDQTKSYVVRELLKQFDGSTVEEMSYTISNISITKKLIDKLARVYDNGVKRTVPDASGQDTPEGTTNDMTGMIEGISDELELNATMKKVNRYLKLHRNCFLFVKPVPSEDDKEKFTLKPVVMAPYLYDVVEKFHDREQALCYIFSHYSPTGGGANSLLATNIARAGRAFLTPTIKPQGDGRDELISNEPSDKDVDSKEYIFWSKKYHFTCNSKGEIVKSQIGENNEPSPANPIERIPGVEFAIDQDGVFWAKGGDDLVDGAILVNCMITNINHVGITQGYGQFWMKGKKVPTQIKLGPNKAIRMEVESKDDPDPAVGFASANPPLKELMQAVEMYVALLMTTNNLTSTGISSRLDNMKVMASGIALIIDKAESMEDVQGQRQIFIDRENEVFETIAAWLNYYGATDQLADELTEYKDLPQEIELDLKFADTQPIMSETEKLNDLQLRASLGINTAIELLMKDDASLNEESAALKLKDLLEDRIKNALFWQNIAPAKPAQTTSDPLINDGSSNSDNPLGDKAGNGTKGPLDAGKG